MQMEKPSAAGSLERQSDSPERQLSPQEQVMEVAVSNLIAFAGKVNQKSEEEREAFLKSEGGKVASATALALEGIAQFFSENRLPGASELETKCLEQADVVSTWFVAQEQRKKREPDYSIIAGFTALLQDMANLQGEIEDYFQREATSSQSTPAPGEAVLAGAKVTVPEAGTKESPILEPLPSPKKIKALKAVATLFEEMVQGVDVVTSGARRVSGVSKILRGAAEDFDTLDTDKSKKEAGVLRALATTIENWVEKIRELRGTNANYDVTADFRENILEPLKVLMPKGMAASVSLIDDLPKESPADTSKGEKREPPADLGQKEPPPPVLERPEKRSKPDIPGTAPEVRKSLEPVPMDPLQAKERALKFMVHALTVGEDAKNPDSLSSFSSMIQRNLPKVVSQLRGGALSLDAQTTLEAKEEAAPLRRLATVGEGWFEKMVALRDQNHEYDVVADFRRNLLVPLQKLMPRTETSQELQGTPEKKQGPKPEPESQSDLEPELTDEDVPVPVEIVNAAADREFALPSTVPLETGPKPEGTSTGGTKLKTSYEVVWESLMKADQERAQAEAQKKSAKPKASASGIDNLPRKVVPENIPALDPNDIIGSAFNSEGFSEFFQTTAVASNPEAVQNVDLVKRYYEAFRLKETVVKGLRELYSATLKKESGLTLNQNTLEQLALAVERRATSATPEFVTQLHDALIGYKEWPPKIAAQKVTLEQLRTQVQATSTEVAELESKHQELAPLAKEGQKSFVRRGIERLFESAWKGREIRNLTEARGTFAKPGTALWDQYTLAIENMSPVRKRNEQLVEIRRKYGIKPEDIQANVKVMEQTLDGVRASQMNLELADREQQNAEANFAIIRQFIFEDIRTVEATTSAIQESAGAQLATLIGGGNFQAASGYLKKLEQASASGESGIDYLRGIYPDVSAVKEKLDINAQIEVGRNLAAAIDGFTLGSKDLERFTKLVGPYVENQGIGFLDAAASKEFVLSQLRGQYRELRRANNPKATLLALACVRLTTPRISNATTA